jgi:hypothetical protein
VPAVQGGVTKKVQITAAPTGSVDNAVLRADGVGGFTAQNSTVVIDDTGNTHPTANDGGALGTAALSWSDLFIALGGVINWNNGDVVITHSAGVINVTTGDLRVTTAGTNAASVVTVGGTQTLTSKTLTNPVLNGTVTGTAVDTAASANTLDKRDANANAFFNNYFANGTATVSAGGTTVLTVASSRFQLLTGSSTQTYQLPNATTLTRGPVFVFNNNSSSSLVVTNAGGTTLYTVPAGGIVECGPSDVSTSNGVWDFHVFAPGTVTWSSGVTGLVMNTALSTTPSIAAGASSATSPSFIPQRGSATTGYGGDSTHLYGILGGATIWAATSTAFTPGSNDGQALGTTTLQWSDLLLATGGVINWNNGNVTITHAAGSLTVAGATAVSLGTTAAFTTGTIELGAASDTTISRSAAGVIAVEGVPIFSNIPQNSQSAAYTTVLADAQKHILHPTADNNARTFTIDSNANVAYPIGTAITFVNQINTVTIAITSDTLVLAGAGTTGSRTLAANGIATALKIASTTWIISGTGLT